MTFSLLATLGSGCSLSKRCQEPCEMDVYDFQGMSPDGSTSIRRSGFILHSTSGSITPLDHLEESDFVSYYAPIESRHEFIPPKPLQAFQRPLESYFPRAYDFRPSTNYGFSSRPSHFAGPCSHFRHNLLNEVFKTYNFPRRFYRF